MSTKVVKKKRPAEENPRRKVAKKKKSTAPPVSEVKIEDVYDDEKMGAVADASASAAIQKMKDAPKDEKRKEYAAKPGGNPVRFGGVAKPLPADGFESFGLGKVKPGVFEIFLIEAVDDISVKPSKWVWEVWEVAGTIKQARTLRKRVEKQGIERVERERERVWHEEHMHDQKTQELAQFKITAKTSDDEMLSWVERAQEIRKTLVDQPPVKKPRTFKPKPGEREFPQTRIRRVVVGVEFEDVASE